MGYQVKPYEHDRDLKTVQNLIRVARGPEYLSDYPTPLDQHEVVGTPDNRKTFRIWENAQGEAVAYAFVSTFNNLYFDIAPDVEAAALAREMISWGEVCVGERIARTGEPHTLDASCREDDRGRLKLLEYNGFRRSELQTLKFGRTLTPPLPSIPFPKGFSLRHVRGEEEAEAIVALHRAAFETAYMTVDERLAIMRAPGYDTTLELLAVAEGGTLAGYLTCSLEDTTGFTDPLAVRPEFQRRGLAGALLDAGLRTLAARGAKRTVLGTSNQNTAMVRVAEAAGFGVEQVKVWLSKTVL